MKETNDKESSNLFSDLKEDDVRSLKDRLEEVVRPRQNDRLNIDISNEERQGSKFSNKGKFFNKANSQKQKFSH